jgi:HD-GYP domain-containing protein (c-di-GMP phosphodiesterase class II)
MELAREIPTSVPNGAPLVRHGVKLTTAMGKRLAQRGVRAVWIADDLGEGVVPNQPVPDEVRRATERAVSDCFAATRALAGDSRGLPDAALEQLQTAAASIVQALDECPAATLAFDDLATADSYTYTHSVRVATLGLVLGQHIYRRDGWVDWRGDQRHDRVAERMTHLGLGLLLHDIGKLAIPETILNKAGKLTAEEWKLIKSHPQAGASLVSGKGLSPLSICIVRDHHERWDGLGYPAGKKDTQTHQFARIAAVADVYDAVTADRPYKAGSAPHVGVNVIREGAGTQFDPAIAEHFRHVVMPYPVGHTITMPDGSPAVVAHVEADQPDYPIVRWRTPGGQLIEAQVHIVDGQMQGELEATRAA